jgi:hypothetical protein
MRCFRNQIDDEANIMRILFFLLPAFERHVHVTPILATFAADWSPFGSALWVALTMGGVAAFLVSSFSPLPVRVRHQVLFTLPLMMALGCLFTRWINSRSAGFFDTWYFYKFYFGELDAAYIACLAFGAAFTLDAVRSGDRACRIVGWSFGPVYIALFSAAVWYINGGFGWFKD